MSFASSSFTGTNGTELTASDAGWVRHTTASASGVNAQIANNRARISASSGNTYYYRSEAPASADYSVFASIVRRSGDSGSAGVVGRMSTSAVTGYLAQHDEGNGWRLFKIVAGSYTQLGSSYAQTLTIDQAYNVELRMAGTSIKVFVDGVERISAADSEITAAGRAGINLYANGGGIGDVYNHHIDDFDAVDAAAGDTTAPVLTSPVGTSTGATTATVGATTDEGNGTLYAVVTTSATAPSVAQIKAGQNQAGAAAPWSGSVAVSSTGAKTINATGLTASTSYYAHLVHTDAATNNSNVVSSAQFTTSAAGDTTVPTLTGTITISSLTTTSYTASWPAGSDNVAVTGYEYRINAGAWTDNGASTSVGITGRTPGSTDTFEVRAYDAAGNKSTPALSQSVTLNSSGTITSAPFKNNAGTVLTGLTVRWAAAIRLSDFAQVKVWSNPVTNGSGQLVLTDAAIATATDYALATSSADGASVGIRKYTAA